MNHISYDTCRLGFLVMCVACAQIQDLGAQTESSGPTPRVIQLDMGAVKSSNVFTGPPETVTMRSGYVVLAPSKSVGKHSTGRNEEVVTVLAGSGEMRIAGQAPFKLAAHSLAYCPPMTEHDVVNTGQDTLRYIWLVAKARN